VTPTKKLYVVVLSNAVHLDAGTGRVITCPVIAGQIPGDARSLQAAPEFCRSRQAHLAVKAAPPDMRIDVVTGIS